MLSYSAAVFVKFCILLIIVKEPRQKRKTKSPKTLEGYNQTVSSSEF